MKRGMRKNFGSNVHYEDYYEYNRAPAIAAKRFRPSYWDESVEDEREGPFYPHEFSPANFSHSFFAEHKHEVISLYLISNIHYTSNINIFEKVKIWSTTDHLDLY